MYGSVLSSLWVPGTAELGLIRSIQVVTIRGRVRASFFSYEKGVDISPISELQKGGEDPNPYNKEQTRTTDIVQIRTTNKRDAVRCIKLHCISIRNKERKPFC